MRKKYFSMYNDKLTPTTPLLMNGWHLNMLTCARTLLSTGTMVNQSF